MPKGGTGTIGGGPRVGGPALGGRPGVSISKAAIGGNRVEAGGSGGQAAAGFRIARALETSPLRAGLDKTVVASEKMTVIGGQPVVRRPGPAEFARISNIGAERTAGQMSQRRTVSPPERRANPDATNKQLESTLGVRIGEFNPATPKGPDIIQRGNGKYSLPSENTTTKPADTSVREAEILRKISVAYAQGPELKPRTAPIITTPGRAVEVSAPKTEMQAPRSEVSNRKPHLEVKTAQSPQSPDITRIMAELNRIGERTKQQAVRKTETLVVGPMAEYKDLEKKVVSLKKDAETKKTPTLVKNAISLLKIRNDARTAGIDTSGVLAQRQANPFDALNALIQRKIRETEDANVVRLRPTDPRKPALTQPERTDGGLAAQAVESQTAAVTTGSFTRERPTLATVTELPQASPSRARVRAAVQEQPENRQQEDNVIYMADRRQSPEQPQAQDPDDGDPNKRRKKGGDFSVDEEALTVRIDLGLQGVADQAALTKENTVDGYDIVKHISLLGNGAKSKVIRDIPELTDGSALVTESHFRSLRRVPVEDARSVLRAVAVKAPPVSDDPPGRAATQMDFERVIKGTRAVA